MVAIVSGVIGVHVQLHVVWVKEIELVIATIHFRNTVVRTVVV